MGVFTSTGNAVLRLAAQHAVESSKESDLLVEATKEQKKAAINQDMASKEVAASLQEFQGYYQIGMDLVSLGQGAQKTVEAGKDLASRSQAMPKLEQNLEGARADLKNGVAREDSASFQALKGTRIGDRTVGERFSDDQLEVIARGDLGGRSDQDLKAMGFSDPKDKRLPNEIRGLRDAAKKDGISTKEGAEFLYGHRRTGQEEHGKMFRDDLQKAIRENVNLAVNEGIGAAKNTALEGGRRAKEHVGHANELAADLNAMTSRHDRAIGKAELDALRDDSRKNGKKS